ncbi:peptidylprolyl isomerase [Flavobacterium eburneipallidum]|uniref:peptidylprolyl isomerase n=1 Tax=Flavobacterium eburneipallidum TaxID=3003263 RepID=UPI00248262CE|nr:peptidylprolyl isomerase [Flavobacterium eburneipallidum]
MKKSIVSFILALTLFSCKQEEKNNLPDGLYAKIETSKGDIIVQLDYEKTPVTVANFVTLAEGKNEYVTHEELKNKPFYDGLKFHRVIPQFMIQGGDPLGTGSGDTGYKFKDEITDRVFDKAGLLAMANSGPGTNSSQFFITHLETPWLDGKHTIFGHVVQNGMETVNRIVQNDDIKTITIIRNGEAAKKFDAVKVFQDYFAAEAEIQKNKAANEAAANAKYKVIYEQKAASLKALKTKTTKTSTGLQYIVTQKGSGKKPTSGQDIYIHYTGFLEDGTLFDTSLEEMAKNFGKLNPDRVAQGGYQPMLFQEGLIPGFIEGVKKLNIGDKATLFIPSNLAYGEAGAGRVIPPNANIIFEIELLEKPN